MLYEKGWNLVFLLLKDGILYYTDDHYGKLKLVQLTEMSGRKHILPFAPINLHEIPGLVEIGPATNLQIYCLVKPGTPWVENKESNAFLLRPVATPAVRAREDTDLPKSARIPVLPKGVIRCTSLSHNFASVWIDLMRLAKYGKQLRENYRAFKNKNEAPSREFSRANVPNPELESPLFRRRGCKAHLKERARKDGSHSILFPMDFRTGLNRLDSFTDEYYHMNPIDLRMYIGSPPSIMVRSGSRLRKLSYTLRRKVKRRNIKTSFQHTESVTVEPQPSTCDIEETPEERAEKAKRFGAIRKIFTTKSRKSEKKKKAEEIEMAAIPYEGNESREKLVRQEPVVEEGILIDIDSELATALQPDDEGATSLNYYAVSSKETTKSTTSVQVHNENEQD